MVTALNDLDGVDNAADAWTGRPSVADVDAECFTGGESGDASGDRRATRRVKLLSPVSICSASIGARVILINFRRPMVPPMAHCPVHSAPPVHALSAKFRRAPSIAVQFNYVFLFCLSRFSRLRSGVVPTVWVSGNVISPAFSVPANQDPRVVQHQQRRGRWFAGTCCSPLTGAPLFLCPDTPSLTYSKLHPHKG